ncbi:enoyl-CoA hydratase/isomerase family protein [Parapedobacter indicus]|uniref:Enoyl-CoA hydratase n=1 Tax=Parapedobacter indicus TaxID=1477437 RepID=A0A1I3TZ12_9SPHI|nr:enoyl-CoA hydratase-related protein [Parapedobacter indicus]PPK99468.1 enoyl-CoA hydratase [Parapedobacter indicus]SFJ75930.1 enoyl-CoA hydratase [Parapedobacter indicus]
MAYQNLVVNNQGYIRHIVINREEKLNALNKQTLAELHDAVTEALAADTVRGIVLTGAGEKAFVAGADISEFANFDAAQGRALAYEGQTNVFDLIHAAEKPIIAAINGYALGGGLELALACHIRVAVASAKLGLPETSLGLIPGYGGTQRLTHLVGRGRALEMILTGDMISATDALEYGLVNHVVEQAELFTKVESILQRIASRSRSAVSAAIKAINASLGSVKLGFETEINLFGQCFGSPDFKEGVSAFLEKRKPNF